MKNNMILYGNRALGAAIRSPKDVLWIILIFAILIGFLFGMFLLIGLFSSRLQARYGKDGRLETLTPTQKYILAASAVSVANNYKCVIDIWDTHLDEIGRDRAGKLYEWSWCDEDHPFDHDGVVAVAEGLRSEGYQSYYQSYCALCENGSRQELEEKFTKFQLEILAETKEKYPVQGLLGWDLVRILSAVGGAYMAGVMEYGEAAEIALRTCQAIQQNFTSWEHLVGSYTLGYWFWRGERKKDRYRHYKKLKRSAIYRIAWETPLTEKELFPQRFRF